MAEAQLTTAAAIAPIARGKRIVEGLVGSVDELLGKNETAGYEE